MSSIANPSWAQYLFTAGVVVALGLWHGHKMFELGQMSQSIPRTTIEATDTQVVGAVYCNRTGKAQWLPELQKQFKRAGGDHIRMKFWFPNKQEFLLFIESLREESKANGIKRRAKADLTERRPDVCARVTWNGVVEFDEYWCTNL